MKYFYLSIISFAFFSCTDQSKLVITELQSPATNASLAPNLYTAQDGTVYLTWLERKDKNTQLKFSKLKKDHWSSPKIISQGNNWFVNWADFPSLIVNDEILSAHWLQKKSEGTYDYDIRISQSKDKGNSWSQSFIPHQDGIAAEHGFVSMLPMSNGKNFATWLDGRNTKATPHTNDNHGHNSVGAMTLRAGTFDENGIMTEGWELDNQTCDCCQTSAAMTDNGPIVVYRDRSIEEIRDIYITRQVNGEWSEPMPVSNDSWQISGCPVNGPSIAAQGNSVVSVWFTAALGLAQVKMATSSNGGESFTKSKVISQGNNLGRVDVVYLKNGQIVMSWLEIKNDLAEVMIARFDSHGTEIMRQSIAQTSVARASGFPVITNHKNQLVVAWTETTGEDAKVKSASVGF